jgi:hypothetical protein
MTETQFWYGDERLLEVYKKAYMRDKSYTAWLQGAYTFEAQSKASYNANRAKKTDPAEQYSQWKDPCEKMYKPKITKDNLEQEFRKQQAEQQAWLFHR